MFMRTFIELVCLNCHKKFTREKRYYTYFLKKGQEKRFCSCKCHLLYRYKNMDDESRKKIGNHLIKEDSTFNLCIHQAKFRNRKLKKEFDIDSEYLKELWNKQNGICPYTGIKMYLPTCRAEYKRTPSLEKLSLDRIDSNGGYTKGNVEFVCAGVNWMKHTYSQKVVHDFIGKIKVSIT